MLLYEGRQLCNVLLIGEDEVLINRESCIVSSIRAQFTLTVHMQYVQLNCVYMREGVAVLADLITCKHGFTGYINYLES